MKKNLCLFLVLCLLFIGGAGCTKEKATALQYASSLLVNATETATSKVEAWWNENRSSVSDLTGKTPEEQYIAIAEEIIAGTMNLSVASIRVRLEQIRSDRSPDPWVEEKLSTLKDETIQIRQSLKDLDRGYLLATDAVKDLSPHVKKVFASLSSLAIDLRTFPMPDQRLDDDNIAMRRIKKDGNKTHEVKVLKIVESIRSMDHKTQDYQESRDEVVVSLLTAASNSMDMMKEIDNFDKLSLKEVLGMVDKWTSLAVKYSGGKLSQSEVDNVANKVKAYAIKIGVLEERPKDESGNGLITKDVEDKKPEAEEDNKKKTDAGNATPAPKTSEIIVN